MSQRQSTERKLGIMIKTLSLRIRKYNCIIYMGKNSAHLLNSNLGWKSRRK